MGKKTLLSILLAALVASGAIGYANLKLPYVKNLQITGIEASTINPGAYVVTGLVDVDFKNHKAWVEGVGGYKEDNFYYMNKWWDINMEGKDFSFDGQEVKKLGHEVKALKGLLPKGIYVVHLYSINWELDEHFKNHDRVKFTAELQLIFE